MLAFQQGTVAQPAETVQRQLTHEQLATIEANRAAAQLIKRLRMSPSELVTGSGAGSDGAFA